MSDAYTIFKSFIPRRLRGLLKPLYLKVGLRSFNKKEVVKVKKYGFEIQIDPINGAVDKYIYMHRNWEPQVADVIVRELKNGETFIDIGANIGYFSLLASGIVGANGKVIAFEPISRVASQMQRSVRLNEFANISIRQVAIGSCSARASLTLAPGNIGGSSLVREIPSGEVELVSVVTLDEAVKSEDRIDFVKIDVEGAELEVLLGAKETLKNHRPKLLLEFSPNMYIKRSPEMSRQILDMLFEEGYAIHDINNNVEVENVGGYLEEFGLKQKNLLLLPLTD